MAEEEEYIQVVTLGKQFRSMEARDGESKREVE